MVNPLYSHNRMKIGVMASTGCWFLG